MESTTYVVELDQVNPTQGAARLARLQAANESRGENQEGAAGFCPAQASFARRAD
jgi:hypothetical protein